MTDRRFILLAIALLGISAVMTQVVLMRELLSAFHGNELVLGAILAAWLILTGLGCGLGRILAMARHPLRTLYLGQILIGLLPLLQVTAVRILRDAVFVRGADVGFVAAGLTSAVLLLPYCLVSGLMLARGCVLLGDSPNPASSPDALASGALRGVYVADCLGSVAGGLLFSFVLVHYLDHFALLAVPASLNLAAAGWLAWRSEARSAGVLCFLLIPALTVFIGLVHPDALTTAMQHPGQTVLWRGGSPYGRMVITEQDKQLNFLVNGLPVYSSHQTELAEETVHYALAQRPQARRVLLLGGGFAGAPAEVLKHSPQALTYVELDRLFLETARRFLPAALADPRVQTVAADGRLFVKQVTDPFDVILVNLPDPSTALLNRFYTAEFFTEARRALRPGGVLCFGLGHYENVVSPELARLLATAHRTAAHVFARVLLIPGTRVFFLASDGPLQSDIASRLEQRGISTRLVNRHFLDAMLTPDRLASLRHAAMQPAGLNTDFNPVLYFECLRHWLSQFESRPGWLLVGLGAALGVYLVRLRPPALAVFASGFAASALEVVLLLGFQALCGSLYQQIGLVVTVFMSGLALGALGVGGTGRGGCCQSCPGTVTAASFRGLLREADWTRRSPRRKLGWVALSIAVLAGLLPFCLRAMTSWPGSQAASMAVQAAILTLTFLVAWLVGMAFPLAGRIDSAGLAATGSRIYTADFMGAGLGAALASAWLIPVLGIGWTCLLVAGLNALAAVPLFLKPTS